MTARRPSPRPARFLADRPYTTAPRGPAHRRHPPPLAMRVVIVAEYYPRAADPTLGVWAHRQALAARDAGAERARARPAPAAAAAGRRAAAAGARPCATRCASPAATVLDGVRVDYVRYLSPPRPWSYASWGAWAAPALRRALRAPARRVPVRPRPRALRRPRRRRACAGPRRGVPLLVSVHGGDVHGAPRRRADRCAARSPTPGSCWPTAPARRGAACERGAPAHPRRAPRHRPAAGAGAGARRRRRWSRSAT